MGKAEDARHLDVAGEMVTSADGENLADDRIGPPLDNPNIVTRREMGPKCINRIATCRRPCRPGSGTQAARRCDSGGR